MPEYRPNLTANYGHRIWADYINNLHTSRILWSWFLSYHVTANEINYYRKCSAIIERATYWRMAYIKGQNFTYIDFNSHISDYKIIKKAGRYLIQNILQKLKIPVFAVYERTPNKIGGKFHYHIHCVIACAKEELTRLLDQLNFNFKGVLFRKCACWQVKQAWKEITQKLEPGIHFESYISKPSKVKPLQKFHYILKFKKSFRPTKPYGMSGSFDFQVNTDRLIWTTKEMPQDILSPNVIKKVSSLYFRHFTNKTKFISFIEFYKGIKEGRYNNLRLKK